MEVRVDERRVASLRRTNEGDVAVRFEDGSSLTVGGVFILPPQKQRSTLAEALGCEIEDFAPTKSCFVKTDAMSGETIVRDVYAVGDMTGPQQSLVLAAASGARTAYRLNQTIAVENAEAILNPVT